MLSKDMNYKFSISFLFVLLALFLQVLLGDASGAWINFTLATLIASVFFVDFVELLVLVLFSVFILNWQPALSWEMLFFACLPFAVFSLCRSRTFPFRPWLVNLIAIFSGIIIVYFIFGIRLFTTQPYAVLWDMAGSLTFGAAVFSAMKYGRNKTWTPS